MKDTMASAHLSNGVRLVSVEGLELPLVSLEVRTEAQGGLARAVVSQLFANPHEQPLKATYTMPLPAGGAVAGYLFRIGDRRVIGEIDRRSSARERYDRALIEGRTAALLDQERSNLFTQELGNIPPRTEVALEITVDQRLDWLADGMWEWRFPTVAAPRYLGAEGRVPDGPRVSLDVADGATSVRVSIDLLIHDPIEAGRPVESPSHLLTYRSEGAAARVTLADGEGAALDRDLVVRWATARERTGVSIQVARPEPGGAHGDHAYGLVTIVPPAAAGSEAIPRDLILLLDTSGSMTGRPLDQARRVVGLLLDSLGETDRLEMIAFSNAPRRWRPEPVAVTPETRREAHAWVADLVAGGGTEMLGAVEEALLPLREGAQRQVVLVTDGEIGFETQIVSALCGRLPAGSRLHAVGIGSAVNDALLRPATRAGRGIRVVVDLDEDPERGAARLAAATRTPVVMEIEITGGAVSRCAPKRPPDLMAGAPVLAGVRTSPEGGELLVRGRTASGPWEVRATVPPAPPGTGNPAITALYAREAVEDLELDLAAGAQQRGVDSEIERIGLEFGISTRLTSWVAISEEPTVDPRQPVRRVVIPQELPHGLSAEGLGLRQTFGGAFTAACVSAPDARYLRETAAVLPVSFLALRRARERGATSGRWAGSMGPDLQVLEFEVAGGALVWEPPRVVQVQMDEGSEMEVEVERSACTRPGRIGSGSLVRLVLRLAPEMCGRIVLVTLESAGGMLVVVRTDA